MLYNRLNDETSALSYSVGGHAAVPAVMAGRGSASVDRESNAAIFRVRDVAVAGAALCLLAPLFAFIAVLIKLDSRGPVFFKQLRGGMHNRAFRCIKFRTLTVCEDAGKVHQVVANDKRVTRVGSFLRRTGLDELPQLINVLRGDMTLVGPRPHALSHDHEFSQISREYRARFAVRPGITGLAQVRGQRGEVDDQACVVNRVVSDLEYIRRQNIFLDLKIMLLTPLYLVGISQEMV